MLPTVCFSLLIFLVYVGFSPILTGDYKTDPTVASDGDSTRQVCFVLLFGLILSSSVYLRGTRALLEVPLPLVALLVWCWLSVAWAIDPEISLRRVLFTTIVTLSVTYAVSMLDRRAVMSILSVGFALILIADWAVIPLLPQAIHQPLPPEPFLAGDWRGIHLHKNEAGAFCALAALVFSDNIRRGSFVAAPILTALAVGFLAMTASKTAEGLVAVAWLAGLIIELGYRNPVLRNILLGIALCASCLLLAIYGDHLADAMQIFEDPGSLTGRVQIWPVLLSYAADHLLLGSGYGSFWAIGDASPIFEHGPSWLTQISHAHNGYIDLLIQTGVIGCALAVAGLVLRPMYICVSRPLPAQPSRWLLTSILFFCWLHDLLESSMLDRANIVWVSLLIAYTLLERRSVLQPLDRANAGDEWTSRPTYGSAAT